MARPRLIRDGKTTAFYIGDRHRRAIEAFRQTHRLKNQNEAIRRILEAVAETEGVEEMLDVG